LVNQYLRHAALKTKYLRNTAGMMMFWRILINALRGRIAP